MIAGLPPHLPLRKDGSNLWGAMQKMVMRDGRIYDLQSVLAKISEIGFAENPQPPIQYVEGNTITTRRDHFFQNQLSEIQSGANSESNDPTMDTPMELLNNQNLTTKMYQDGDEANYRKYMNQAEVTFNLVQPYDLQQASQIMMLTSEHEQKAMEDNSQPAYFITQKDHNDDH